MTTADDPLDGADVGESATIYETVEIHPIDYESEHYYGTDRTGSADIEDVEVVENEYGEEILLLHLEGEITKTLPYRWDETYDPSDDPHEQSAIQQAIGRVGSAVAFLLPIGIAFTVANLVFQEIAGEMTINGEPVSTPGMGSLAFSVFLMTALIWVVYYGVNGGLPRTTGGLR